MAALLACTRIADDQRFPPNDEKLVIIRTVPEAGSAAVDPLAQIDFCFSDYVDPKALDDLDATLSSGSSRVDAELELQLFAWRGPGSPSIDSDASEPWCEGSVLSLTPKAALRGGVRYRVRLQPSAVGWAGEGLDTETPGWTEEDGGRLRYFLEFTVAPSATTTGTSGDTDGTATDTDGADTGTTTGTGGDPEGGMTLTDLFAEGGVLDPARASCSCHTEADSLANQLLDLRTASAAFEDLVVPGRLRDTGFPMVSPRRPSESFLIHKLLRRDGAALFGVLGDAMPKDGPLAHRDLVTLVQWIESGAEL